MDIVLAVFGWSAFGIAVAVGLALDMVGWFGNWIILGAVAVAWLATGMGHFGWLGLGGMLGLAGLGELLEFALAGYGAKKFGGSKGSMWAALAGCIVGAIVGTPWFPVVGTLLGACAGAFAFAALYEYIQQEKKGGAAVWVGVGAALGKVGGIFAKLLCGLAILAVAAMTW